MIWYPEPRYLGHVAPQDEVWVGEVPEYTSLPLAMWKKVIDNFVCNISYFKKNSVG